MPASETPCPRCDDDAPTHRWVETRAPQVFRADGFTLTLPDAITRVWTPIDPGVRSGRAQLGE